ncbi:MAG: class I SAM-dependent methyltransferase, partial [Deltaproteobacteria bacterium]|nr:class I SAM-dependent methyltransferase [Deltaproteobacteria bacterium]
MNHNFNHTWNSTQYSKTSALQAAVSDELIKKLQIKPDEHVLDIGCGIGNITMDIASLA